MTHRWVPEKLVEGRWPHDRPDGDPCDNRQAFDKDTGIMLGGCPFCWSRETWRWHCVGCSFVTEWVMEGWAADEEIARFAAHHIDATRLFLVK